MFALICSGDFKRWWCFHLAYTSNSSLLPRSVYNEDCWSRFYYDLQHSGNASYSCALRIKQGWSAYWSAGKYKVVYSIIHHWKIWTNIIFELFMWIYYGRWKSFDLFWNRVIVRTLWHNTNWEQYEYINHLHKIKHQTLHVQCKSVYLG